MFYLAAGLRGQASVLTWHNDSARTGQNLQETILTPANVNSATFGRLFTLQVDGKVDAQPLYVPSLAIPGKGTHNVVYVVTEHDSAYAFDADSGALLWSATVLGASETPSDDRNCGQITPEMGISATPVIDAQRGTHGTIYIVAMSKNGSSYHQRLHALDLATGAEEFGGPVEIQATYAGSGVEGSGSLQTFDPKQHKERAALLLLNGVIYTTWSSHCDVGPYTSWVIGYDAATLAQVSVLNLTPNGNDGGIWMAGGGPAADASGNFYLLMGNGSFDTSLDVNSFPSQQDYGNAFVKIRGAAPMSVLDFFTMSNTVSESNADQDLGSGGILLLPSLNDSQGQPRSLAVGAGKDGNIYVVDTNNLGKFRLSSDSIYQEMRGAVSPWVFSTPAWFNGKLYYGPSGSNLRSFQFSNGSFSPNPVSQTTTTYTYPGTTPSISANGTQNGIVWTAENGAAAVLHAYDASDLSHELYNSNQAANGRDSFGAGNKFIVPTVVSGKVYVATTTGVGVFGLLCVSSLTPGSASYSSSGGSGQISVGPVSGCSWNAQSNVPWLTITSGSSGSGAGMVNYAVAANSGFRRNGWLTVGDKTFLVSQDGLPVPQAAFRGGDGGIRLATYPSATLATAGGLFASDPTAAQDGNGNTFVTARDNFNSIWVNVYSSNTLAWSGWRLGGGLIQGVPAIGVDTAGTAWIATRDQYNSYWLVSYTTGSGFGSWIPLLGIFSTDPAVTACGDGSIYVIGKDNYNSLWSSRYVPGAGFQGWTFGGGIVAGTPSATCGGDNAVYLAVEDRFNSNWIARIAQSTWTGWFYGGAITSVPPRIAALGNGSEAVVILDSSSVVWRTTFTEGTGNGWQPWMQVGGILADVAPEGVSGQLYWLGKGPTGDLWWWQQSGNQWTWIDNNGAAAGALASTPR
ncbi:MAG: hypothetical protein LAO79_14175 [Acidobacteriia bacterium]|nr:hypothetical protein [Terriglobia bacterium]